MKTWLIIFAAIVLFTVVAVVIRMVGEHLQWKDFQSGGGGKRLKGQIVIGCNEDVVIKETKKLLEYVGKQFPQEKITVRKFHRKGILKSLQRGELDFVLLSDRGIRDLDNLRRHMKVSYTEGKIATDIVGKRLENHDLEQIMYALWDDSCKNPVRDRIIDTMMVDSSRLKNCYSDYM